MATWSVYKFRITAGTSCGILGKIIEVYLLQICFVIGHFRSNGYSYKKCMATPCIDNMEGFYFGQISDSTCCLNSKRQCLYWQIWFSEKGGSLFANAWRLLIFKVWRNITLDGFLIQDIAEVQSVDALIGEFYFQKWRFFVSIESQTVTALNSLFEEMTKIIPWSRCSGDPTSGKMWSQCRFAQDM